MSKAKKPFAVGDRVKFTRRNGAEAKGKIVTIREQVNGWFFHVDDVNTKKIIKARESQLSRA